MPPPAHLEENHAVGVGISRFAQQGEIHVTFVIPELHSDRTWAILFPRLPQLLQVLAPVQEQIIPHAKLDQKVELARQRLLGDSLPTHTVNLLHMHFFVVGGYGGKLRCFARFVRSQRLRAEGGCAGGRGPLVKIKVSSCVEIWITERGLGKGGGRG